MKRSHAFFHDLWHVLHEWRVGPPLLFVFVGLVGLLSITLKGTPGVSFGGPLVRTWEAMGLPVRMSPQWGFMGHGGYLAPVLFLLALALGCVWSGLGFIHAAVHWHEDAPTDHLYGPTARIAWQLFVAVLRATAFAAAVVAAYAFVPGLTCIVAQISLLWFAFLALRASVSAARRRLSRGSERDQ